MLDLDVAALDLGRGQFDLIVVLGRVSVGDLRLHNHEEDALLFQVRVAHAACAQKFNPAHLEILQKSAVMQIAHRIDFGVTDAKGDRVGQGCIGRFERHGLRIAGALSHSVITIESVRKFGEYVPMEQEFPISGYWRISEMELWDQAFIDAETEGYFRFDHGESGEFQFGYVHASMTCEATERGGKPAVEWSWEGNDEMDHASGRGWASLDEDGKLQGRIYFSGGDKSSFIAIRAGEPQMKPAAHMRLVPDSPTGPSPTFPPVDQEKHSQIRVVLQKHQNTVVKTVSKAAFNRTAKKLELLDGEQLMLESESELVILYDHLIYDRRTRGKTPVERYLAKLPKSDDPVEQLVRQAMMNQQLSLFQIEDVYEGLGVSVRDLLSDDLEFVADLSLSQSVSPGWTLAMRLLPLPDYSISSGAVFPIHADAVMVIQHFGIPLMMAIESDLSLASKVREELAAAIIGAGYSEKTTAEVEYR